MQLEFHKHPRRFFYDLDHGTQLLGYQGFVINPVTEDSITHNHTSNVAEGGNYYQENTLFA
jgi:hypothetical protein